MPTYSKLRKHPKRARLWVSWRPLPVLHLHIDRSGQIDCTFQLLLTLYSHSATGQMTFLLGRGAEVV